MIIWVTGSILAFVLAVIFAGVLIPQILLISFRKRLFDEPDERKIHKGAVPRLGGIAFLPVILLVFSLLVGLGTIFYPQTLFGSFMEIIRPCAFNFCALLILWIVGMADDLIGIRYRAKFVVQIICAILMICGGIWFDNFHGFLGFDQLSMYFGYPFTILIVVLVINSINLIDGIDGLASGLTSIAFFIYGLMFFSMGQYFIAICAFSGMGVLLPFFYFNVFGNVQKHKKIFMGDTGSLTMGMLVSLCAIFLVSHSPDCSHGEEANPLVVAFAPLIVPCFDVVRVYFVRLKDHKSPFLPDRNHIHHLLLARGWSQRKTMVVILGFSLFLSLINILASKYINVNWIILGDILIWIAVILKFSSREQI